MVNLLNAITVKKKFIDLNAFLLKIKCFFVVMNAITHTGWRMQRQGRSHFVKIVGKHFTRTDLVQMESIIGKSVAQ